MSAGSTVSEPSTAVATTRTVASPIPTKILLPVKNMPQRATRPVAPITAVSARPSGSMAATSAPKVTSKTNSAIGTESRSAFSKSLPAVSLSALWMLASPASAMS